MNGSNSINIKIEKNGEYFSQKINIKNLNNNEVLMFFSELEDSRFSVFFDSNVEITFRFDFEEINSQILYLYFLINGLQKYKPKSIHLILPYLPYTDNDITEYLENKSILKLQTHFGFMSLIQQKSVASISTYDMWNPQLKNYSNIYLSNIKKDTIFEDVFSYFKSSRKAMFIMALNEDDYNLLYSKFSEKSNIKLINCSFPINFKSKKEIMSSFLKILINNPNVPIYIFDKDIITGSKLYNIIKHILKEAEPKELNMYITHGIFSKGSYRKFNNLFETHNEISTTIYTTDSIYGYNDHINKENVEIVSLDVLEDNSGLPELDTL